MDRINFSTNWNGKLNPDAKFFTTIRKYSPVKHIEGRDFEIFLKDRYLFKAELYQVFTVSFGAIHPNTIIIDTGYSYDESCKLFMNFLHCTTIDQLKAEKVDHLLFKKINKLL